MNNIYLLLTFYRQGVIHKVALKTTYKYLPDDGIEHLNDSNVKETIRNLCNQDEIAGMVLIEIEEIMDIQTKMDTVV